MSLNSPSQYAEDPRLEKFQKLALAGFMGLASNACMDTRTDAIQTIQAEPATDIDPRLEALKRLSTHDEDVAMPESDEKPRPKVVVKNENSSEGFQAMAELAPGRSWVGSMEGNGGRDVMIYLPEAFDESKPYELIYFFHGTGASVVQPPSVDLTDDKFGRYLSRFGGERCVGTRALNQVLGAVERGQDKGHNQVVVYPLSEIARGTKRRKDGTRKKQDLHWMIPGNSTDDSMFVMHDETMEAFKTDLGMDADPAKITIKGHSAGGAPLDNILVSGFPANRADFLDATYWPWGRIGLDQAYDRAIEVNPDMEINIFVYYVNGKTDRVSRPFRNRPGVVRIDARGIEQDRRDWEGHRIIHGKMMRNYWNWER